MSLFLSSSASVCVYAMLPDEFIAVLRRIENAADAALFVASVSAILALGYRLKNKKPGKNTPRWRASRSSSTMASR